METTGLRVNHVNICRRGTRLHVDGRVLLANLVRYYIPATFSFFFLTSHTTSTADAMIDTRNDAISNRICRLWDRHEARQCWRLSFMIDAKVWVVIFRLPGGYVDVITLSNFMFNMRKCWTRALLFQAALSPIPPLFDIWVIRYKKFHFVDQVCLSFDERRYRAVSKFHLEIGCRWCNLFKGRSCCLYSCTFEREKRKTPCLVVTVTAEKTRENKIK